ITVFDVDLKNGKDGYAKLKDRGVTMPPTPTQVTPTGGTHYFCAYTPGLVAPGSGIDVKNDGGYIVAAPSTIKDSVLGEYAWIVEPDTALAPVPAVFMASGSPGVQPVKRVVDADDCLGGAEVLAAFEARGLLGVELAPGKYAVTCPWAETHGSEGVP